MPTPRQNLNPIFDQLSPPKANHLSHESPSITKQEVEQALYSSSNYIMELEADMHNTLADWSKTMDDLSLEAE